MATNKGEWNLSLFLNLLRILAPTFSLKLWLVLLLLPLPDVVNVCANGKWCAGAKLCPHSFLMMKMCLLKAANLAVVPGGRIC